MILLSGKLVVFNEQVFRQGLKANDLSSCTQQLLSTNKSNNKRALPRTSFADTYSRLDQQAYWELSEATHY